MRSLLLLVVGSALASNKITFVNNCKEKVQVVRHPSGANAGPLATEYAVIAPGQTASGDFTREDNVFTNGFDGRTKAHIYTNVMAIELYRISVAAGFDTPMQIESDQIGAPVVTCGSAGCGNTLAAASMQGSNYTLTFCPS